jgi:outer membrane protein assembly factor BamB
MKSPIYVTNRKQTASFRIAGLLLAIAPLWLMLAAANMSVHAQTSSTPSPADWTQFLRNNMERWNPYETVLGVNNVGDLRLKWKNPLGVSGSGTPSSPAVVNGVVYFGTYDGIVHAVNASTTYQLWSYTGATFFSSPAVANGVVYIGSLNDSVYALNASTGEKLWSYATGNAVFSSPAVANGVVYIGSADNNVYALNASTGAKLWSYATGNAVFSSPAVANGVVYIGSADNNVYALNASTGAKLWSYATGDIVNSSPAVANGVVYFGSDDSNVYALNASTGAKLWSFSTGSNSQSGVEGSPAVANGVVYIGSANGNMYALNASTGAELWSYFTSGSVLTAPAVANGVVYMTADDVGRFGPGTGDMLALNASTGALLWSYSTGISLDSSPSVVDGVLYIAGEAILEGNNIYAFGLVESADLFLRIWPTPETVHQGDLLTYAFPVWNLGPGNAVHEVLTTQVPAGTTFDYIRISGTPGLATCTHPLFEGTGPIVCSENNIMAADTTWTVRLTVKVTAPSGTVITENATATEDTPDPNLANNTATVSTTVQ